MAVAPAIATVLAVLPSCFCISVGLGRLAIERLMLAAEAVMIVVRVSSVFFMSFLVSMAELSLP